MDKVKFEREVRSRIADLKDQNIGNGEVSFKYQNKPKDFYLSGSVRTNFGVIIFQANYAVNNISEVWLSTEDIDDLMNNLKLVQHE